MYFVKKTLFFLEYTSVCLCVENINFILNIKAVLSAFISHFYFPVSPNSFSLKNKNKSKKTESNESELKK